MDSVTLAEAKLVSEALNEFAHSGVAGDLRTVTSFVRSKAHLSEKKVLLVMEFLQTLHTELLPVTQSSNNQPLIVKQEDFNLLDEVNFSYGIAKALLERSVIGSNPDAEEIRKNLKSVTSFLDVCVKLQERVLNIESIQRFRAAVMDALEEADPAIAEVVVQKLLEYDL